MAKTKKTKKITSAQKEGLKKGQKLMQAAVAWQKAGGYTTVTVKKYKRNTKTYLKNKGNYKLF